MGSYQEIKGNLLDMFDNGDFEVIAHGCNCQCVMGAGIAKQISDRYIRAYYADMYYPINAGVERLGNISYCEYSEIFNLYTQVLPGKNADIRALEMCLMKFTSIIPQGSIIGLPQIGCGIGGLNWNDVKPLIQKHLANHTVIVVIYEKYEK